MRQVDAADRAAIKVSQALPLDMVAAAGSGHAGTAMSLAPVMYLLFQRFLRHDPADPAWIARDRFVLSAGHASVALYVQLYLAGYGLELDELRQIRKLGSRTPGHPELGHTPGVETTTGPLGQGLGNAVGMAMANAHLCGILGSEARKLLVHRVWCIVSDGDLAEGVSHEVSSLAGTMRLPGLIAIWDDNRITIGGSTKTTFSENTVLRYQAYGWHTITVDDGDDIDAVAATLNEASQVADRPVFIRLRTTIGSPMPTLGGTAAAHAGVPNIEEIAATKKLLGMDPSVEFEVPDQILAHTRGAIERGSATHREWCDQFAAWEEAYPDKAALHRSIRQQQVPASVPAALDALGANAQSSSTRAANRTVLSAVMPELPWLWGGSADLAESNGLDIDGVGRFFPVTIGEEFSTAGGLVDFGVREHGMAAIVVGMALEGAGRVFAGTYLTFADYMRPSVRLAAMMALPVIYIWTHDSVAVGEDGPTHQPIEHLWAYRAIPGLSVVRPADWIETVDLWKRLLVSRSGAHAIVLSRQSLPVVARHGGAQRGAYVLADGPGSPDVVIIASGSEVSVALQAREQLCSEGVSVRVVSAPCLEWFVQESAEYRAEVLPPTVRARVAVEAGSGLGWGTYVGTQGEIVGIDEFGRSGAGPDVLAAMGITVDRVVAAAKRSLARAAQDA